MFNCALWRAPWPFCRDSFFAKPDARNRTNGHQSKACNRCCHSTRHASQVIRFQRTFAYHRVLIARVDLGHEQRLRAVSKNAQPPRAVRIVGCRRVDRGNLEHNEATGLRQHERSPRWIERAIRQQLRANLQSELVPVMLQVMRVRACSDAQTSDDSTMNDREQGDLSGRTRPHPERTVVKRAVIKHDAARERCRRASLPAIVGVIIVYREATQLAAVAALRNWSSNEAKALAPSR